MPTASTVDITRFLTPISEQEPAGPELRNASDKVAKIYLSVRDARKRAIDAERRLSYFASMSDEERKAQPGSPDPADWESVRQKAIEALTRSKDLWVTAWLIEALTRLHGFAGLRDGVQLARHLCDRFWGDVHPQPSQERDLPTRFAQLAGLDGGGTAEGTLIAPILNIPITAPRSTGSLSLADYKDAVDLERKAPEIRLRRIDQGAVTIEMFNQAVAETPAEFFQDLRDDLDGANNALVEFTDSLRDKEEAHKAAGGQPFVPPTSNIREVLGECLRLCKAWGKPEPKGGAFHDAATATALMSKEGGFEGGTELRSLGSFSVETRHEALQTLLRVSEYFRRAEPHSPISYALEQIVRWGRMSLPELLAELVSDKSARDEIFKRSGITQEPD